MATIINIYDYSEVDPYWGFEEQFVIGYGKLTAENINREIDAATGDLDVHINSGGGKVFDGWAIYNKLKSYQGGKVTVYVDGIAASIASIIAMAGETVVMAQASMMMVHKPTGFYIGAMDADELASEAQSLTEIESVLVDVYATKTGLAPEKLQSLIDATTWLSPDSALALGFCDTVLKDSAKQAIPQNVFDRLFENASESTRTYANSAFTIKQNNMSTVTVKELSEKQEKQGSMLTEIWNAIIGNKKNEVEGEEQKPAEGETQQAPDEPTLEQLKAENAQLKAEAEANKEKLDNAQSILDKANDMYTKMENTLSEIKSNYQVQAPEKDFTKSNTAPEPEGNFVKPIRKK